MLNKKHSRKTPELHSKELNKKFTNTISPAGLIEQIQPKRQKIKIIETKIIKQF